jgi:type III protein arginine methyltransferase
VKLLCFSLFLVKKICCSDTRNERTLLDPLLSEDAFIMPCKGILRFCAMSLPVSLSNIYLSFISLLGHKVILSVLRITMMQDLWRSRRSLKDVEGFDHSVVNDTLGACGDLPGEQQGPCLPYYVWQCGYTKVKPEPHFKHMRNICFTKRQVIICHSFSLQKLSEVYSLMDLNFSEPIHSCFGETKVSF